MNSNFECLILCRVPQRASLKVRLKSRQPPWLVEEVWPSAEAAAAIQGKLTTTVKQILIHMGQLWQGKAWFLLSTISKIGCHHSIYPQITFEAMTTEEHLEWQKSFLRQIHWLSLIKNKLAKAFLYIACERILPVLLVDVENGRQADSLVRQLQCF